MSILVVGGTKGIGLAIAKAFAADAGDVFLGYRSDESRRPCAAEAVAAAGGRPHLVKADIGTPEGAAALTEAVRAKMRPPRSGRPFRSRRLCDDDAEADPLRFAAAVTTNGTSLLYLFRRRCRKARRFHDQCGVRHGPELAHV